MAARRAERMVNLVLCLLSTRQFLTAEQIRRSVPGYEPDDRTGRGDEAFKRMFERDKAELRELGIPLETGRTSMFDVEDGYRIAR
ncbi:MAG: proteasome accessory factor B, partial [Actinomycetota bacterium]|nr:proteasome accessory factor B [Actinomycetota bacterium]